MSIADWIPVVLFVLGFIQLVLCGIMAWALLEVVILGKKVVKLEEKVIALQNEVDSHRDDAEKKFDELKEYITKLFEKIDNMNAQIGQVLLHRRAADKPE